MRQDFFRRAGIASGLKRSFHPVQLCFFLMIGLAMAKCFESGSEGPDFGLMRQKVEIRLIAGTGFSQTIKLLLKVVSFLHRVSPAMQKVIKLLVFLRSKSGAGAA